MLNAFLQKMDRVKADLAKLQEEEKAARSAAEQLREQYEADAAEVHEVSSAAAPLHSPEVIRASWLHVLEPLRAKLAALHRSRRVECGVLGFSRSEAASWRDFWLKTEDGITAEPRRVGRTQCLAPFECRCAHCAARQSAMARGARRARRRSSTRRSGRR